MRLNTLRLSNSILIIVKYTCLYLTIAVEDEILD